MQLAPFWTADQPRPADLPVSELPPSVDVAIVGSGYTGLNAARTLARAGASVAVLEQATIGWGASSRNGGMLNTGLKDSMPALFRRYGAERGRQMWHWSLAAIDHVSRLVSDEHIVCNFVHSGQVVLACKPSHFRQFCQEVAWHKSVLDDDAQTILSSADLSREIGSGSYFGGILDPRAAALHPAKYVFGLARAVAKYGVCLVEHAPVRQIRSRNSRYRLVTPHGEMVAKAVLLATNGYTTGLVPSARRGIFPAGSYIITTEPLSPDQQAQVSPARRMFYDSKHFLNYFRLTPDGRMLFGGRHDLSTNLDLATSATALQRRMEQVFPQLSCAAISHSWTGQLGLTFDLMPHIGRIAQGPGQGIFYAYGYGGHGVAAASLMGHQAGEILAGTGAPSIFAEIDHPHYFFAPYERLYLPLVSRWYRFLDRVS